MTENTALKPETETNKRTPLYDLHVKLGGKMVPFAGYDMPVQYGGAGVLKEHLHTRSAAGLFDVSHMGQVIITSADGDPAAVFEQLVPGDIQGLKPGQMRYSLLLNDKGGIVDDLIATRIDAHTLFVVINAGCKDKDLAYLDAMTGGKVRIELQEDRALLALQGPKAESVIRDIAPAAASLVFMTATEVTHPDFGRLFITRSGYTGEDGFEISVDADQSVKLAEKLLAHPDVQPIGLGARDSLRLEAGLCLYGHDLDDTTTPVEANLKWAIQKRRRLEGNFKGAATILAQIEKGAPRYRVGIKPEGRAPMREGTELFSGDKKIGVITSGGFGPSLDAPVAMGYVDHDYAANGTQITAMLRGQPRPCTIVPMPFITNNYKKD